MADNRTSDQRPNAPITGAQTKDTRQTRALDAAAERLDDLCAMLDAIAREHLPSPDCWCHPTLSYIDLETGRAHYIHHDPY